MVDFKLDSGNIMTLSSDDIGHIDGLIGGVKKDYLDTKGTTMGENAEKSLNIYRTHLCAVRSVQKFAKSEKDLLPQNIRWTIIKTFPFFTDLHKLDIRIKKDLTITRNLSHVWIGVFDDDDLKPYIPKEWMYSPILWVKKLSETDYEIYGLAQIAILNLFNEDIGNYRLFTGMDLLVKFDDFEELTHYV